MDATILSTRNVRQRLTARAVVPGIGMQQAIGEMLSIGLSARFGEYISQEFVSTVEDRNHTIRSTVGTTQNDNKTAYETGNPNSPAIAYACSNRLSGAGCTVADTTNKKPLGSFPMSARLGLALFATQKVLITADLMYHGEAKGQVTQYRREAVFNQALGLEAYLMPSLPLRAGLFTNNDSAPKMSAAKYPGGQPDHVDYMGGSLFLAWVQPNSQVALGAVHQVGKGEARKTGDATIQKVEATATTVALSATHNF